MKQNSGQAVLEYILLLSIVISLYTAMLGLLSKSNVMLALKKPLEKDFKFTYQYGHPKARGQNDGGGPLYIPQHHEDQNFRIFINPPISE